MRYLLSPVIGAILCNVTVADDIAWCVHGYAICLSHAFKWLKREHIGDARAAFGGGFSEVILST